MRIAVIGAGISGLACAYVLGRRHDVSVFEQSTSLGGHAHTTYVPDRHGNRIAIDTGFIVYNEPNYPYLTELFAQLDVPTQNSDMSFSVHCERTGYEFNGSDFNRLFAQRSNLGNFKHWRMLVEIMRFHTLARKVIETGLGDGQTVQAFIDQHRLSDMFVERYLVPLGASLWSSEPVHFRSFPIAFVLEFLHNHGMLQVEGRPQWRTVSGGSRAYVERLAAALRAEVHLGTEVRTWRREGARIEVQLTDGQTLAFDEVIVAVHADQAMQLGDNRDTDEQALLANFPYRRNEVILHKGVATLPDRKRAWAAWNYRIPNQGSDAVPVTYYMNRLQNLPTDDHFCVSLNSQNLDPASVLKRYTYAHPTFGSGRASAQSAHAQFIRRRGVSFCGAYWGYGFHEDGIASAMRVCQAFGMSLADG